MSARDRFLSFRIPPLPCCLSLFLAILPALPRPALAADPAVGPIETAVPPPAEWGKTDLRFRGVAHVLAIEPGGSLALADGRRLRLAGIVLPSRPLRVPPDQPWPIEAEAEAALTALTAGKDLQLYQSGQPQDRYGRLLVQALREDGLWLQTALLRQGLARVETAPGGRLPIPALLGAEALARRAGIGLWALPAYRVKRPAEADAWIDSMQLVEGRITAVHRDKDGLRLAFGGNRRHAFSVHLPFAVWTDWAAMPTLSRDADGAPSPATPWTAAPSALVGQRLRVRGWIGSGSTAEIDVGDTGQIEWIAPRRDRWRKKAKRRSDWE
ncbi:thermonuclease family protein [Telmatospirillum sp.]|uniref:thermonuclease family protein n=1 Tax=Telmatospirillum sp. TaxID=2079197 RepID=UPI00284D1A09|nr:thermonuclease family protein [Telmatospirillum sp.]MDR3436327.1 thermonuclease family protein [Telmatospirillum sp.]